MEDNDEVQVLQNNWMKGEISLDDDPKMNDLKLKMISRHEDVQVS